MSATFRSYGASSGRNPSDYKHPAPDGAFKQLLRVLQFFPVYLPPVVLRQGADELDPARVLVEREARLDELFDVARQLF